jgi:hypothetical protein
VTTFGLQRDFHHQSILAEEWVPEHRWQFQEIPTHEQIEKYCLRLQKLSTRGALLDQNLRRKRLENEVDSDGQTQRLNSRPLEG